VGSPRYGSEKLAAKAQAIDAAAAERATEREAKRAAQQAARQAAKDAKALEDWSPVFLRIYALCGSRTKASKAAGVAPRAVKLREQESPEFVEQVKDAHAAFVESLEEELVKLGKEKNNALALMMRLKAEAPSKYEDKLRVDGALKHLHGVAPISPEAAADLLRTMLLDSTESTRAVLAATPALVALPLAAEVIEPATIEAELIETSARPA